MGLLLLATVIIAPRSAKADGPPAGFMTFYLRFHVENISIVGSKLFLCKDKDRTIGMARYPSTGKPPCSYRMDYWGNLCLHI